MHVRVMLPCASNSTVAVEQLGHAPSRRVAAPSRLRTAACPQREKHSSRGTGRRSAPIRYCMTRSSAVSERTVVIALSELRLTT